MILGRGHAVEREKGNLTSSPTAQGPRRRIATVTVDSMRLWEEHQVLGHKLCTTATFHVSEVRKQLPPKTYAVMHSKVAKLDAVAMPPARFHHRCPA